MQIVGLIFVGSHQGGLVGAPSKFFAKTVADGRLVVGFGDVFDGYRFRTVRCANPIGIGQIDTDGRGGVAVAGQYGCRDDFCRNAFHFFFLKLLIHRRMVFEPLCISTDGLGAFGCFGVFEVHYRFPTCFHAERVAVSFGKSVHKIDGRCGVGHPQNGVFVEGAQIACAVKLNQPFDDGTLLVVFGYVFRLFEPINHFFERSRVEPAHFVNLLADNAVAFHQFAVQPIRHRLGVVRVLHGVVESLGFGLCYAIVVVAGRGQHQVGTGFLVGAFG